MSLVIAKNKAKQLIIGKEKTSPIIFHKFEYDDFIKILGIGTLNNIARSSLIESGIVGFINNKIVINSKVNVNQLLGHFYEALLVNLMNINCTIKYNFFSKCCFITEEEFSRDNYGYAFYQELVHYSFPVAKGQRNTQIYFPNLFCPSCKDDIAFYIKKLNNNNKIVNIGKFQVKAINGNEKNEIIIPMLNGTYEYVITLLRNNKNHSYQRCEEIIDKMLKKSEITYEEADRVMQNLWYPEQFNIPQGYIDDMQRKVGYFIDGVRGQEEFDQFPELITGLESMSIKVLGDKPRCL